MKAKAQKVTGTYEDALRLLHASGQTTPSHQRVELTRWIIQTCIENGWGFTKWEEPLYPALDSFGDTQLFLDIEETFGVILDEVEMRATSLDTFGDLVEFFEPRLTSVLYLLGGEREKIVRATCKTQTAFYVVRRRLCDAGAAYHVVHASRPYTSLRHLRDEQAKRFVRELSTDYGLDIPLRSVLWGWMEAEAMMLAFFIVSVLVALALALNGYGVVIAILCFVMNVVHGCLVWHFSRFKWPEEYQTLGDVARKIAATVPPAGAMQAAS